MSDKKLSNMRSYPSGTQVFSVMKYAMENWPNSMAELYEVYDKDAGAIIGWCTGFAYALAVVEDNGIPQDLDDVLHDWLDDGSAFHIDVACEEWLRDHRS